MLTLKGRELDHAPICSTWTVPDVALGATVATIWASLQLTTLPKVLPSITNPVPCADPKPEPETATCTPAAPAVGDTLAIVGVLMAYVAVVTALSVIPLL